MDHKDNKFNGHAWTERRSSAGGRNRWNGCMERKKKKSKLTAAIGPVPKLTGTISSRAALQNRANLAANGGRSPQAGRATRWHCYDRPGKKVRKHDDPVRLPGLRSPSPVGDDGSRRHERGKFIVKDFGRFDKHRCGS
jgi:hypothetical protein